MSPLDAAGELAHLLHRARGLGQTTALVAACQQLHGVLVTHDTRYAAQLSKEHGVKAISVTALKGALSSTSQPIFVDNHALALMLDHLVDRANVLVETNKTLTADNVRLCREIATTTAQLQSMQHQLQQQQQSRDAAAPQTSDANPPS